MSDDVLDQLNAVAAAGANKPAPTDDVMDMLNAAAAGKSVPPPAAPVVTPDPTMPQGDTLDPRDPSTRKSLWQNLKDAGLVDSPNAPSRIMENPNATRKEKIEAASRSVLYPADIEGPVAGIIGAIKNGRAAPTIQRTSQMMVNAARQHFDALDKSGVRIDPSSFKNFSNGVKGSLEAYDEDFAGLTPNAEIVLNGMARYAEKNQAPSFAKLERWNQTINKSANATTNRHDALVLGDIKDNLDEYGGGLDDSHILPGTGTQEELDATRNHMLAARDLWRRNALMSRFEDIRDIAEHQDDPDLFVRQRITAITRKPKLMAQYTPEQQAMIVKIANRGSLGELARAAPHLTPAGMVKGAIYMGSGAAMGPVLPAAIAAGSTAAHYAAPILRQRRIGALLNDIAGNATPEEIAAARAQARGTNRAAMTDADYAAEETP